MFVSDDTLTDISAASGAGAAAEASSSVVSEALSSTVKKSNPAGSSAALLSTEIFDVLQAYPGTLGQLIVFALCCML